MVLEGKRIPWETRNRKYDGKGCAKALFSTEIIAGTPALCKSAMLTNKNWSQGPQLRERPATCLAVKNNSYNYNNN